MSSGERYERPVAERYLRIDASTPDGGCIDLGLEARPADDAATERALETVVEQSLDAIGDSKELAERLERLLVELWPDRYWFAEVWTPGAVGLKRYQVIQPAVVGGFRR